MYVVFPCLMFQLRLVALTCIVTSLSSTITSLVRKSAPMVALYCDVNFLLTYWFIRDVLPTLCVCVCVVCVCVRVLCVSISYSIQDAGI